MITPSRNLSGSTQDPVTSDDATWILTSSFVIFTMQTGFGLLESGAVTKKNEVNILMKNTVDVILGGMSYWMFGYGLQYGKDKGTNPFCGVGSFFLDADMHHMGLVFATFIFQLSFATTATTIVSGAMAERTDFNAYCIFSFFNTFTYCIPAGWLWGDHGFLRKMGVLDFAGASGVHLLGGSAALMAAIVLKPRLKRYEKGVDPLPMGNPTYALVGMFTLWWGWLVFNCGSTFGISNGRWQYAARAAVNTINASLGGGVVGVIYTYFRYKTFHVQDIINAILGSMVAITGGSAFYHAWESLMVGAVGAFLVCRMVPVLDQWKIDDPVSASTIHGVGGAWGMIAVGILVDADRTLHLTNDRQGLFKGGGLTLLGIQIVACLAIVTWSTLTTLLLLKGINLFIPIRMAPEEELLGADFTEHDIQHECYDYEGMIEELLRQGLKVNVKKTAVRRSQWNDKVVLHYVRETNGSRRAQNIKNANLHSQSLAPEKFLRHCLRKDSHCVIL